MAKSIIAEGKTSTEAIENGLKELKVSKDKVDIKILENEDKRSFFSILAPRVVKVELTLREGVDTKRKNFKEESREDKGEERPFVKEKREPLTQEEINKAKENLTPFLEEFTSKLASTKFEITSDEQYIYVTIEGEDAGRLIGYRGETLNAMQTIMSSIANKGVDKKVSVLLDIEGYREKRKVAFEELADKLARTVIRSGKQVTLEPMSAYERKIIHNRLQDSQRVRTYSVGEEPYRKVIIAKK